MIHSSAILVYEALAIGVKAGIDPERLYEIWNLSTSSRFVQGVPRLLERQFENPSFTLALTAKDVALCVEAAREMNVPTGVAAAASQVYVRSLVKGYGPLLDDGVDDDGGGRSRRKDRKEAGVISGSLPVDGEG